MKNHVRVILTGERGVLRFQICNIEGGGISENCEVTHFVIILDNFSRNPTSKNQ